MRLGNCTSILWYWSNQLAGLLTKFNTLSLILKMAALGAPTSVKNIQLNFGYPPYAGRPTVHNGPAGYYTLRTKVRSWLHYNGLYTTAIIVDSGAWDALVARIMHSPDFPQPAAGAAPVFPRSSSPSTWSPDQWRAICTFIRELCKVRYLPSVRGGYETLHSRFY